MIDRALSLISLLATVIFGLMPYYITKLPRRLKKWSTRIGLFFSGVAVCAMLFWIFAPNAESPVESAVLRLHVFADNRLPDCIHEQNIFRWYYYSTSVISVESGSQPKLFPAGTILVVSFSPDVKVSTLRVRSPDTSLPPYEVKEFNQRFAIVVFAGRLPDCTLDVAVQR